MNKAKAFAVALTSIGMFCVFIAVFGGVIFLALAVLYFFMAYKFWKK